MRRAIVLVALGACSPDAAPTSPVASGPVGEPTRGVSVSARDGAASDEINPRLLRRFRPVVGARHTPAGAAEIALGRKLFFDVRLSVHEDISCNTCHALDRYGVDGRTTSIGNEGGVGRRNAPSVLNAADHIAQFWDGRAATVETQAIEPLLNPIEMGMPDAAAVLSRLQTPDYASAFHDAYPEDPAPITTDHLGSAFGAFERGLVTSSPWDAYLAGDATALNREQRHGLQLFLEIGCVGCHTGPQVGGTMFQHVGVIEPWPNQRDLGRFEITHVATDRMVFKVPSLKNIARTAPYFHDGSVATLGEAVRMMGRHQLGLELEDNEVGAIVAWMGSMTGRVDRRYISGRADRDAGGP